MQTLEHAELLARETTPSFSDLLDGIKVARGNDRWDLVETLSDTALASVTGTTTQHGVAYVARQLVIARIQGVSFEDLQQHIQRIAAALHETPTNLATVVHAVSELEEELMELATILADDSPASLVSAGARLRKLHRSDLAIEAATLATERDPSSAAAMTVRAAAHTDLANIRSALADASAAEQLRPSPHTANVLARIETQRDNLSTARDWAKMANERDPNGIAGAGSLMKIAALDGDREEAEFWSSRLPWSTASISSAHWLELVAAKELMRGPRKQEAEKILTVLWLDHEYAPARSILLEEFGHVPERLTLPT